MNTAEIDCVLRRLLENRKANFVGVFAADMLPIRSSKQQQKQQFSYPYCFVINTDPANKPGEHWVAAYADSPTQLEFFDSYGLPVTAYSHIRGLHNVSSFNQVSLQPIASQTCGHFCIYYLNLRTKGRSLDSIVRHLEALSPSKRDSLVRSNLFEITRLLSINRPCISDCKGLQCCKPRRE